MEVYQNLLTKHRSRSEKLDSRDRQISIIRLILIVSCGLLAYRYIQTNELFLVVAFFITLGGFISIIIFHQNLRWENSLIKQKIQLLQQEISFLENGDLHNDPGTEFSDPSHAYSYDLDFFGNKSFFQNLNRTSTVTGKRLLANSLLKILPADEIIESQEALRELTPKTDWRLEIMALGQLNPDTEDSYRDLISWSKRKVSKLSALQNILSYLLPAAFFICLGATMLSSYPLLDNICIILFLLNLVTLGTQISRLKSEMVSSTEIDRVLKQYSLILKRIESSQFESKLLVSLQEKLQNGQVNASVAIHRLSRLFLKLDHLQNVFASPVLNGTVLYHIHILRAINNWRKDHALYIEDWLEVIGRFEQLNSLANFSFNNPSYIFPSLNKKQEISFSALGHPLIPRDNNVTNDISFHDQQFFILTGSNMSGKSTFLRTLGINMVLSGIGAPVFARKANVHPLPVLVSMRLSDSLTDSESYFYAEVKRLKHMMEELDQSLSFVLLDEILRGTNSDDKRNGTLGVIRKLIQKNAIGGIATHDLEVCRITEEYPQKLVNKRFEVEIINNELKFDYKLKDGICENKSASFIMEKMEII